jgi:DNA repair exonuclease SbcCD ATPase subunit
MQFGKLIIENFFRIKHLSIDLYHPGLFAVLGKNLDTGESNEAGKSTIFEALCWCLWGRYAAGGARAGDEIINPEVGKNCRVYVQVIEGYLGHEIERTKKDEKLGDQLIISRSYPPDNEEVEKIPLNARNVASTTKLIENILGMNYETFVRGYYFPQEGVQSFGFMKDKALKDFFLTELLDLSWIEEAHANAKVHKKELAEELLKLEKDIEYANDRLEGLQAHIVTCNFKGNCWKEERKEKLKELGKEIRNERDKIQTVEESKLAIEKKIEEYEQTIAVLQADRDWSQILVKADAKYLRYVTEVSSLEPKIESLKKEIEECNSQIEQADNLPGTNCNECGSLLDHSHLKFIKPRLVQKSRDLQNQWEALMMPDGKYGDSYKMKVRERDALASEIEGLKEKIEAQKENDKQIVEFKEKLTKLQAVANMEFIQRTIDDRKKQMVEKAKEKNPYVELVNEDAEKIKETIDKINRLSSESDVKAEELLEVEFWIQAFSVQGIQSYVLDGVTKTINRLIANYMLDLSDGRISARFETVTQNASGEWKEKFKLEINNMDGGNSYISLSGGAKRRVDLAVALAVSEYKRSLALKELEFLVLDEATSGMDEHWNERFISLLKNRLTSSSKYFITHQHLNSSWFDDEIVVVKRSGETLLEDST